MWRAEKVSLNSLSFPIRFTWSWFSQNNMYLILLLSHPTEQIISCQGALSNLGVCVRRSLKLSGHGANVTVAQVVAWQVHRMESWLTFHLTYALFWLFDMATMRTTRAPRAIKVCTIYGTYIQRTCRKGLSVRQCGGYLILIWCCHFDTICTICAHNRACMHSNATLE